MKTPTKVITALALAGIAVAGGAAFTGGGLTNSTTGTQSFVGGAIGTNVTGAALNDVDYTWHSEVDGPSSIQSVTLTFDTNTPTNSLVAIDFVKLDVDGQTDLIADTWEQNVVGSNHQVTFTDDLLLPGVLRPRTVGAAGTNSGKIVEFPVQPNTDAIKLNVTVVTAGADGA